MDYNDNVYRHPLPQKGKKKDTFETEDGSRGGNVEVGQGEGYIIAPIITLQQQLEVIKRLEQQKRLKVYYPERRK